MATNKKIGTLLFRIESDTRALRKGLNQTRKSTTAVQKSMIALKGAMIGTFGAYAVINAMRNVAKTFMDFEQSMANVKAITRANQGEFERLSKLARNLGGSTKYTATQVAELEVAYGKLGFTVTEIEKAAKATLYLAAAVGTELGRAAEVAGGVLRAFQMDTKETTRVTDVMARSFTNSALDMEKFAEAMKYVAPVAANVGLTLEETTSLLALLANNMIDGSMAGTSLRMILSQLTKSGKPLAERLKELSTKGLTLADAEKEVGRRAQTALLILTKQSDMLPELTKAYENAGGAAEDMANIQLNTLQGRLIILQSAFSELKITIGLLATDTGIFGDAIDDLTTSIQKISAFLPEFNKALGVTGLKLGEIAKIIRFDLAGALGKIAQRKLDKLVQLMPTGAGLAFVPTISGKAELTKTPTPSPNYKTQRTKIGGGLSKIYPSLIAPMGMGIEDFEKVHQAFVKSQALLEAQSRYMNDMAVSTFTATTELGWFNLKLEEEGEILDGTNEIIAKYVESMQKAANDLQMVNAVIAQSFTDMFTAIGTGLGEMAVGGLENVFDNILKTMADFAVKFGVLLIAMGIGREALDKLALTGVGAIIAGISLVALGTAMKGLLAKGPMGGGVAAAGGGSGGTGGVNISGELRARGSDLVVVFDRATSQRNQIT